MGRLSPGMAGGVWLISSMSRARARAMRGWPGVSRVTVMACGVKSMVPAEAADDGLAGDGAVFVVVAQVGVQLRGEPVLGVVREQPQHHLQAPPPGAQQGGPGFGVDLVRGQFRGDALAGCGGGLQVVAGGGDLALRGGDGLVLGGGGGAGVGEQGGQRPLGGGQVLFRVADGGVRRLAGGAGHHLLVHGDRGEIVADLVDAVVLGCVLEEVLLPPPRFQPGQDVCRAGGEVGGEDLHGRPAVLEQGDLPGLAVVFQLHLLLGPGDDPLPAGDGGRGEDREFPRDGQRGAPPGHPVHLVVPAVPVDLRVGAAAVEPEHDRRAGRDGLLQLGEGFGQRGRQPGRLCGYEAHRAPVVRGDVGVRAAPLGPAPLVVPALGDGLGPGIGDEVVIDVVHPRGHRVGGEHRGREHLLQSQRVVAVSDAGQRREPV